MIRFLELDVKISNIFCVVYYKRFLFLFIYDLEILEEETTYVAV